MKKLKFFAAVMTATLFVAFLSSCNGKTEIENTTSSDIEMETVWSKPDRFEMPSEHESQNVSDGSDVLLSMIDEASEAYSLFVSSKPLLDMIDTLEGADGVVYYRIADKNLDTFDKFNAYLQKYFSNEIVTNLLNVQMYVSGENGNMYAVDVGMSSSKVTGYSVEKYEETDTKKIAVLKISRDTDGDGKTDVTEDAEYVMEPSGKDGRWVFTRFSAF